MHFASISLGIFDFLIEWIANFIGTVVGWVFQLIMEVVNRLIFTVVTQLLSIVDFVQILFKKLAGLDIYWVTNGQGGNATEVEGDILLSLITNSTVIQVLITLTMVAVLMVIVGAIIKIVQSEFTTEGSKNSKAGVFGQALKSLMLFILVPLLCIGGIGLSNGLLRAIDSATSLGGSQSMASQIFVSASASANKARIKDGFIDQIKNSENDEVKKLYVANNPEQTALNIDNAFRRGADFKTVVHLDAGLDKFITTVLGVIFQTATMGPFGPVVFTGGSIASGAMTANMSNYANLSMVINFYDIGKMNMIILIGGALVACYVMIVTSFGLIMRLFKAAILFMISPPIIALTPLDNGKAFGSWRTEFVQTILSGYGAVVGLNLLFIILPVVNNINLFQTMFGSSNILNEIVHLLFTLVALFMIKDLIALISKLIGAENATASGEGMAKKAGATALKVGMAATGVGGAAVKAIGKGAMGGIGKMVSGGQKVASNRNLNKAINLDNEIAANKKDPHFKNDAELQKITRQKEAERETLLNKAEKQEKKSISAGKFAKDPTGTIKNTKAAKAISGFANKAGEGISKFSHLGQMENGGVTGGLRDMAISATSDGSALGGFAKMFGFKPHKATNSAGLKKEREEAEIAANKNYQDGGANTRAAKRAAGRVSEANPVAMQDYVDDQRIGNQKVVEALKGLKDTSGQFTQISPASIEQFANKIAQAIASGTLNAGQTAAAEKALGFAQAYQHDPTTTNASALAGAMGSIEAEYKTAVNVDLEITNEIAKAIDGKDNITTEQVKKIVSDVVGKQITDSKEANKKIEEMLAKVQKKLEDNAK